MTLFDSIGWKATGACNRIVDQYRERQFRIETSGWQDVHAHDANRYATFAYSSIMNILDRMQLQSCDVFADIGCGKGRVVCCAARYDLQKAIGIEIDEGLCAIAMRNAERLRGRRGVIEIIHAGAQAIDYRECTALFLFNSFGVETLQLVMKSIELSLQSHPRLIRFAYVNPFHEHVLKETPGFKRVEFWHRRPWSGLKFDVSFWEADTRGV